MQLGIFLRKRSNQGVQDCLEPTLRSGFLGVASDLADRSFLVGKG